MITSKSILKTIFRLLVAATSFFALALQLYLIIKRVPESGFTYTQEIIRYISYMTIWCNILVTLYAGVPLLVPRSGLAAFFNRQSVQAAVFIYIAIVGTVYYFVLAGLWQPKGLQFVADVLLHYAVPVLFVIYWIFFVPKDQLKYKYALSWLLFPFFYIIYAMARGAIIQQYPYPFIDVVQLGYPVVLRNIVCFTAVYLLAGLLVVFVINSSRKILSNRPVGY